MNIRSSVFSVLAIAGTLFAVTLSVPRQKVHADNGCSVQSLNGPYSFSGNGFFAANGNLFLASTLGRIVADGAGGFTGSETVGNNGVIFRGGSVGDLFGCS